MAENIIQGSTAWRKMDTTEIFARIYKRLSNMAS
jgi:hypothetical protein